MEGSYISHSRKIKVHTSVCMILICSWVINYFLVRNFHPQNSKMMSIQTHYLNVNMKSRQFSLNMISGFDTFCANSKKDILPSEETLESNIFSFNSSVVLDTRILFESKDKNFFMNIDKHISCIRNVIQKQLNNLLPMQTYHKAT